MKKLAFLALVAFSAVSFAQSSRNLNEKISESILPVLKDFNFNGKMTVEITQGKDGKISEVKTFPNVDNSDFQTELKRAVQRVNFSENQSVAKVYEIPVEYYTSAKDSDERQRYTHDPKPY